MGQRQRAGIRRLPVRAPDAVVREPGIEVPLAPDTEGRIEAQWHEYPGSLRKRKSRQKQVRTREGHRDDWLQREGIRDLPYRTRRDARAPAPTRLVRPARHAERSI